MIYNQMFSKLSLILVMASSVWGAPPQGVVDAIAGSVRSNILAIDTIDLAFSAKIKTGNVDFSKFRTDEERYRLRMQPLTGKYNFLKLLQSRSDPKRGLVTTYISDGNKCSSFHSPVAWDVDILKMNHKPDLYIEQRRVQEPLPIPQMYRALGFDQLPIVERMISSKAVPSAVDNKILVFKGDGWVIKVDPVSAQLVEQIYYVFGQKGGVSEVPREKIAVRKTAKIGDVSFPVEVVWEYIDMDSNLHVETVYTVDLQKSRLNAARPEEFLNLELLPGTKVNDIDRGGVSVVPADSSFDAEASKLERRLDALLDKAK